MKVSSRHAAQRLSGFPLPTQEETYFRNTLHSPHSEFCPSRVLKRAHLDSQT